MIFEKEFFVDDAAKSTEFLRGIEIISCTQVEALIGRTRLKESRSRSVPLFDEEGIRECSAKAVND